MNWEREEPSVCMVYDELGNAMHCFDWLPEELEAEAARLRAAWGEASSVTYDPSPFVLSAGGAVTGA